MFMGKAQPVEIAIGIQSDGKFILQPIHLWYAIGDERPGWDDLE